MLIIDSHLDLAWNAHQWNRDIRRSVYTIRTSEVGVPGRGRTQNTVALPEMRKGRIALCWATLLARSTGNPVPHYDFADATQAFGIARGQLAYYRALERQGEGRVITTFDELNRHMAEWEAWDAAPNADPASSPPLGFVISMESADPILTPDELDDWYQAGVRFIGPAHYGKGRYAGGTSVEDGFSDIGFQLLKQMERLGIVLDMTHLTDKAFWEAVDVYGGPIIASHNNCRALVPHQRQFSDEQLKFIIERDGVIGAAFDAWMLKPGWVRGETTNQDVSLTHIVDHIDHVCQVAGNSKYVGIGSDLDGGFGREQSPCDLDTIADLQRFVPLLTERGYSGEDIAAILHGNWLRLLRRVWQ
jgi:membrane dipeptidase